MATRFDHDAMVVIFQSEGSKEIIRLPAAGLRKTELMGELSDALPIYQLALLFSLEMWRHLKCIHNLIGTTLLDPTKGSLSPSLGGLVINLGLAIVTHYQIFLAHLPIVEGDPLPVLAPAPDLTSDSNQRPHERIVVMQHYCHAALQASPIELIM